MANKTLKLNPTQVALLRNCVLRDLQTDAKNLAEQVHEAHECGGKVIGQDAQTMYRMVAQNAELLDALGWSVDGDVDLLLADGQRRRATTP